MVTDRKIHREYLAVTKGVPDVSGIVDAPIGRKDGSTIERQIDFVHGETARTHYELLTSEDGYSLVRIWLDTGRTHQIRVHMKYLGYPLPGDFLTARIHKDKTAGTSLLPSLLFASYQPKAAFLYCFTSG